MLRYRADIDGLRAVAIVPILLFHAGVEILRGGYIGVDVFFVISGFLITQILMGDFAAGRFSITRFYQRRIARILPALFVILAFVLLIAPLVLVLPGDIAEADRSVAAASGFVSNIYFWSQVSYFARAAESQLLLHTWSLGVEEQFYIFYPLLLVALHRLPRRWLIVTLAVIGLLSLGAGLFIHPRFPTSDFYLLPFRAWELLLGALVGLGAFPTFGPRLRTTLALGGAGITAAGMLLLAAWLPFPSPLALVPGIGTALIIGYGEGTIVSRALSLRPVRWIGQISYSLYLWHWPLITLYRQLTGDVLDWRETLMLVAASVVAAATSFYVVERPSQRLLRALPASRTVAIGLAGVVAFVAAGLGLAKAAPRLWPVSAETARIAAFEDYDNMTHDDAWDESMACFVAAENERFDAGTCLATEPGVRNVVLLGDSHANMYGASLRRRFPQIHWLQATYFGCPPVVRGSKDWRCSDMVERVIGPLASSGKVQGIILASRWRANQAEALAETVRLLRAKGLDVTVLGPVTEYEGNFPSLLARAVEAGNPADVRRFLAPDRSQVDKLIGEAAQGAGARYLSSYDVICPGGTCQLFAANRTPMHFDYGHLTDPGAEMVVRALKSP